MDARKLALLWGAAFLLTGVLGFVPNPLVGPNGLFLTNAAHNIVHLLIGIVLFAGSRGTEGTASRTQVAMGILYLVLAVLGYTMVGTAHSNTDMMLGIVHINGTDTWLHVGLGLALIATGMISRSSARAGVRSAA